MTDGIALRRQQQGKRDIERRFRPFQGEKPPVASAAHSQG
jgi:hypothetical protein